MGIGVGNGENRAADAAKQAISSPLLEQSVEGATGILLNITGGRDLGLFEVNEAAEIVQAAADANANIIFGSVIDESMGEDVRVTVIATGFDRSRVRRTAAREDRGRFVRDKTPRVERPALQIADDDIDIPPFLRDN
jgi:cell division protein FtsZ